MCTLYACLSVQLHKAFSGFESEKLELERRHSHSQARLQEEASATLRRAREQHCTQATSTVRLHIHTL